MLNNFRFLTSGESHGKCLTGIIEGIPSGIKIDIEFINEELKRRQGGVGRGARMQIETDKVEIISGVRFGKTTGAPITLVINNKDFENWQEIMSVKDNGIADNEKAFTTPRPGHADFAGAIKYDLKSDLRNILERSSARKTAMDVAIGAVAKLILKEFQITSYAEILEIGGEKNNFEKIVEETKAEGDTLGGKFKIIFKNLPVGLGSHVQWDRKLDGLIAQAVMSIPAIKSVEIGLGEECSKTKGSKVHDEIYFENGKYFRKTNNAGGIEGGISNGEDIIVKAVMKPIPTLKKALNTIDFKDNSATTAHFERSDVCAVEACSIVAEAMIACVLADAFLDKFGKDNIRDIKITYKNRIEA